MISEALLKHAVGLVERGRMPDPLIRLGIRALCRSRRRELERPGHELGADAAFDASLCGGAIAPVPEAANEQHYELPPEFLALALGPYRKYSGCHWGPGVTSLGDAEASALSETCARAGLTDGQRILELGCGWGSLTLWMAERYPNAEIVAVSNSAPQRHFIEGQATERGFGNVRVITADMNDFDAQARFDRIVSVEMFEHMRNYRELLRRVSTWLEPDGRLFLHVFCHRSHAYPFETEGEHNWMGRHFFTGGIMPSEHLFERFDEHLAVERRWRWDGTHYQRTAEAWLKNLDRHRAEAMPILERVYGADAERWFHRWRVFFLACAELFGARGGREWFVSHQLLAPVGSTAGTETIGDDVGAGGKAHGGTGEAGSSQAGSSQAAPARAPERAGAPG